MAHRKQKKVSRRDFIKWTGSGALAIGVGSGPFVLFPEKAAAQQKTLKILQWSHFVPAYDTWFDQTFCKQWGQKHDTNVVVDHINLVDLNAKAASEASARKGHDLFMLLSPPAAYEKQTIDMAHVYQEVGRSTARKSISRTSPLTIPKPSAILRFPIRTFLIPATGTRTGGPKQVSPTVPTPGRMCASALKRFGTKPAIRAAWDSRRNSTPAWPCARCCGRLAEPSRMKPATSPSIPRRRTKP